MFNDSNISMFISLLLVGLICLVGYLAGLRAIKKIPVDNLRERILCAVNYCGYMIIFFYLANANSIFLPYLIMPNEWSSDKTLFMSNYTNIEALKIAYRLFFFTVLMGISTFFWILKAALKTKN